MASHQRLGISANFNRHSSDLIIKNGPEAKATVVTLIDLLMSTFRLPDSRSSWLLQDT
ncbi:hypothetical protein IE81DRAFT_325208 [Ceraceosorus guamensis]|uniref:Uncharacterized protein n=1 Tax=Ceraceosorus guamensis TaxID=1522189 RepID=A0A316VTJ8_9BASI|nr:hypothetical protein IE81DRAFT_325208 [Ceraceosorus guamensis]PWN40822.1 hypothetical protein IE81DRAFT_325208 [Ceraceosorus guamensis]